MDQALQRRVLLLIVTAIAIATLSAATLISRAADPTGPGSVGAEDLGERAEEGIELRTDARAKLAAQRFVERSGDPVNSPVTYKGFDGTWAGEVRFGDGDDWEPAIGADPNGPNVYVMTTRFGDLLCPTCADPSIVMRVSNDGGHTWGPESYLCESCDNWQYDPQVEVDENGTVHATWLANGWHTWYVKSTDGGATWSTPIDVKGDLAWSDHGFLTVSPDGMHVYVAFNKRNSYVAASHDGGNTFAPPVQTNPDGQNLYYFHYEGTTNQAGVFIAAAGVVNSPYATHKIRYYTLKSTDGGVTWQQVRMDVVQEQPDCYTIGCRHDHWSGLASLDGDQAGNMVYAYVGARSPGNGQLTYVRTSHDFGATWGTRMRMSPKLDGDRRVIAAFPALATGGAGDFRLIWMDNRNGLDSWNVWHTSTTDAGATWTAAERISDATGGADYKHVDGFDADYGDYEELSVNNVGESVSAMGEALSYRGPGGTWMNVEENV